MIIAGFVVLLFSAGVTRVKIGIATVLNMILIGVWSDVFLHCRPAPPGFGWVLGTVVFTAGVALGGLATGIYITAGLGAGPRRLRAQHLAHDGPQRALEPHAGRGDRAVTAGSWQLRPRHRHLAITVGPSCSTPAPMQAAEQRYDAAIRTATGVWPPRRRSVGAPRSREAPPHWRYQAKPENQVEGQLTP